MNLEPIPVNEKATKKNLFEVESVTKFRKLITLTYAPGDFVLKKFYLKSLCGDGGYCIALRQSKARVFRTQGMVNKAIEHVRAAMCGLPERERPIIEQVAL